MQECRDTSNPRRPPEAEPHELAEPAEEANARRDLSAGRACRSCRTGFSSATETERLAKPSGDAAKRPFTDFPTRDTGEKTAAAEHGGSPARSETAECVFDVRGDVVEDLLPLMDHQVHAAECIEG